MHKHYTQTFLLATILVSLICGHVDGKTVNLALTIGGSAATGTVASSQVGSEINIRCNFDSALSRSDEPSIYYQKTAEDEPELVTRETLEGRWKDDNSYKTTYDVDSPSPTIQFIQLRIISATVSDSGLYECRWTEKPNVETTTIVSRVSVDITILAPTKSVEFLGLTDGKLSTSDGTELDVQCKAVGGSLPSMTLTIGETAPQTMSVVVQPKSESNDSIFIGTLSRMVFTAPLNGLNAVCKAKVEGLQEKQAEAIIFLRSGPKIDCDQTEVRVDVRRTTSLLVTCTVTSNPLPTRDRVEWITQGIGNPVSLNSGNNFNGGIAGFTSTVTIDESKVTIELNVMIQDFKLPSDIRLFVSNEDDNEQQVIKFVEAGQSNGGTGTQTITACSTLSFLLSALLLTV